MPRTRLAAVLCCALLLAACSSAGGGGGGAGGDDGAGGGGCRGPLGCEASCAMVTACLGADYGGPTCVRDCEAELAGPNAATARACLVCVDAKPCAAIYPPDGIEGACADECSGRGGGRCTWDTDCDTATGETCSDPDRDGTTNCNCGCNTSDLCDLGTVDASAECACDLDCIVPCDPARG